MQYNYTRPKYLPAFNDHYSTLSLCLQDARNDLLHMERIDEDNGDIPATRTFDILARERDEDKWAMLHAGCRLDGDDDLVNKQGTVLWARVSNN